MSSRIVTLPGDGIGPEILPAAQTVLEAVSPGTFEFEEQDFGGIAIDRHGDPLPPATLEACRSADAVLLAAVGGPKWDHGGPRPEAGLLGIRKALGLFANLRPVRAIPALAGASPLKDVEGVDLLVVRELTGGIYFGDKVEGTETASDLCIYSREEVERIARVAFTSGRERVTSVDKANVLASSRLWRNAITELHAREFADIELRHLLVDNAAMQLVTNPRDFDVIVTENMFGDILSDEASILTGSIGLLPSASLGGDGPGLFEPVHGSAPDIAGSGAANPLAMILSAAMMLRHGLGLESEAAQVELAVDAALADGLRTADLGGSDSTEDALQAVVRRL
jgi:3-isopropylmalate dehydrogenase